jgi:hypothetical protein
MTINNILIKSSKSFNQRDYLERCDLINKYLLTNIHEIPDCSSIVIKYKNSSLFLENNVNKFQVVLFFYFIFNYLPVISYKQDFNTSILLVLKLRDNQHIKNFLENLMLENVIVLKKKLKKSIFLSESYSLKKQLRFKLVFSIQNFYLNNELNLIFNDLYVNNLECITLCVNFNINKKLYSRLVGSSKEDFLKNFLYFWSY